MSPKSGKSKDGQFGGSLEESARRNGKSELPISVLTFQTPPKNGTSLSGFRDEPNLVHNL
jgi:hypothetical protein